MRLLTAALVAALTLASVRAQTPTGVLVGTVRDTSGGTIPGAEVFAQTGDARHRTVSDKNGGFRFELPAGRYRVEVELAGFRRTIVEPVIVPPAKQAEYDLTLRPAGLVTTIADYVIPIGGLAEVLPQADVVAHLRIVRSSVTRLVGEGANAPAVEHDVVLLTVIKGARLGMQSGPASFVQTNAGVWLEDGSRHVGQNAPYRPGDEFVTLLRRGSDGRLQEFLDRYLTFRVSSGRVTQQGGPIKGFTNGMTLENFLEVLRKLV